MEILIRAAEEYWDEVTLCRGQWIMAQPEGRSTQGQMRCQVVKAILKQGGDRIDAPKIVVGAGK